MARLALQLHIPFDLRLSSDGSWTLTGLAGKSRVDAKHLDAFERGKRRMFVLDLSVIQRVLEAAGVKFTDERGVGVRLGCGTARHAGLEQGDAGLRQFSKARAADVVILVT